MDSALVTKSHNCDKTLHVNRLFERRYTFINYSEFFILLFFISNET